MSGGEFFTESTGKFLSRLDDSGQREAFDARVKELKAAAADKRGRQEAWAQARREFEYQPAPPTDPSDLLDAGVFSGNNAPPTEWIAWAAAKLDVAVEPTAAPAPGAWSLLLWARRERGRFFERLLPLAVKEGVPADKVAEDQREYERMATIINRIRGRSAKLVPCPVCGTHVSPEDINNNGGHHA